MDASGNASFRCGHHGKTVLKNLDIWKEAGTNTALRK